MTDGPVEGFDWPKKLRARRVSLAASPRLDGYDVRRDLAPNYSPASILYCSLTGELPPTEARLRAFEIVLAWWAPVTIAEAPSHAASLAMLTRAATSSVLATGAVALAEQARDVLDRHQSFLSWLADPTSTLPDDARASSQQDRDDVQTLQTQIDMDLPTAAHDPSLEAALIGLLFNLGLVRRAQMEAAIVWARLPCVWAEALSTEPADFRGYPMNVPEFTYEGADDIE